MFQVERAAALYVAATAFYRAALFGFSGFMGGSCLDTSSAG